jgi:hypothetical protein
MNFNSILMRLARKIKWLFTRFTYTPCTGNFHAGKREEKGKSMLSFLNMVVVFSYISKVGGIYLWFDTQCYNSIIYFRLC